MSRQQRVHRSSTLRPPSPGASRTGRTGPGTAAALQRAADRAGSVAGLQALQRVADTRAAPLQRVPEEEEPMQGRLAQRIEEEEPLQGKALQRTTTAEPAAGAGLPAALKAGVESLSGVSMDGVRVHRDSPAPASVGALAYAQGDDVHLAAGQERHLPHEAWHVAQQRQGRVAQTATLPGGAALNDDPAFEREADLMGAKALTAVPDQPHRGTG